MKRVFFFLFLAGCASQQLIEYRPLSPKEFWSDQSLRKQTLSRVAGKIYLTLEGKRKPLSGKGNIRIEPNRMRLELRDPLGRLHYLSTLKGQNFVAYYPRDHLAYLDPKGGKKYLMDFLGLELESSELSSLLFGILPEKWTAKKFETWTKEKNEKNLNEAQMEKLVLKVDPSLSSLREAVVNLPSGKLSVEYSEFEPCDGVQVARVVKASIPGSGTLEFEWEKLSRPGEGLPDSSFEVEFAKDDEKIRLN